MLRTTLPMSAILFLMGCSTVAPVEPTCGATEEQCIQECGRMPEADKLSCECSCRANADRCDM